MPPPGTTVRRGAGAAWSRVWNVQIRVATPARALDVCAVVERQAELAWLLRQAR